MNCQGDCNQGRRLCVHPRACGLITANSDGSDPNAETRNAIQLLIDLSIAVIATAVIVFVVFAAVGYWSAR